MRCGVTYIYSNSVMRSAEVVFTLQLKWGRITLIYERWPSAFRLVPLAGFNFLEPKLVVIPNDFLNGMFYIGPGVGGITEEKDDPHLLHSSMPRRASSAMLTNENRSSGQKGRRKRP